MARCIGCPRRQSAWSKANSRSRTRILEVASGGGTRIMKFSFSARISPRFSCGIVSSGTTSSWYAQWVMTLGPVQRKDKSPRNLFHKGCSSTCPRFLFFDVWASDASGSGALRFSMNALRKIGLAKKGGRRPPLMSLTVNEAPCFKSFMTISIWEFRKAMQRGVSPLKSAWSTSQPCAMSQSAHTSFPSRAAAKSGVCKYESRAFTSNPRFCRIWQRMSAEPLLRVLPAAANIRLCPCSFLAFGSADRAISMALFLEPECRNQNASLITMTALLLLAMPLLGSWFAMFSLVARKKANRRVWWLTTDWCLTVEAKDRVIFSARADLISSQSQSHNV